MKYWCDNVTMPEMATNSLLHKLRFWHWHTIRPIDPSRPSSTAPLYCRMITMGKMLSFLWTSLQLANLWWCELSLITITYLSDWYWVIVRPGLGPYHVTMVHCVTKPWTRVRIKRVGQLRLSSMVTWSSPTGNVPTHCVYSNASTHPWTMLDIMTLSAATTH